MKKGTKLIMAAALASVMALGAACQQSAPVSAPSASPSESAAPSPSAPAAPSPSPSPSAPAAKIHLTFWDENADPNRSPILQDIIGSFNSSQDKISVEYVGVPQTDVQDKYNVAITAGETPDIGGLQGQWLSGYVIRGAVIPLDDYFNAWDKKGDMTPSAIQSVRDIVPDGKLYMIPDSLNTACAWYRTDLFKAAGVAIPKTWDEFFAAADKLTDKANNKYGFTMRGGSGGATTFIEILYNFAGNTVFDSSGKCTINSPANIDFTTKYFGMYGKNTPESDITAAWKEMAANFDGGTSAMLIHNLGSYKNHMDAFKDQSKFEADPLPVSQNGNHNMSESVIGYMIFKNSKNPDAAWEFLKYFMNEQNNSKWNKAIGQLPVNTKVMSEDWVKQAPHINTMLAALNDPATTTMGLPFYLPDYASIASKTIEPAIQEVMTGKMSAKDMLDLWADQLNKSKADYDKNVAK